MESVRRGPGLDPYEFPVLRGLRGLRFGCSEIPVGLVQDPCFHPLGPSLLIFLAGLLNFLAALLNPDSGPILNKTGFLNASWI